MDTRQLKQAAAADFMQSLTYLGQILDEVPAVALSEEERRCASTETERQDAILSALADAQPSEETVKGDC